MSKATIHIGTPKTGTTSIQGVLARNREVLERNGVNYPTFLPTQNHVDLAAYALPVDDPWSTRIRNLRTPVRQQRFRDGLATDVAKAAESGHWVFSSEHLSSRVTTDAAIRRLAELFEPFDEVQIVVYVRPQDTMAAASHSTWIKDGSTEPFGLDRHLSFVKRYDYRQLVERWDRVFGADAVHVRLYPPRSVVDDFLSVIGVPPTDELAMPERANRSLDSKEAAFVQLMSAELAMDPDRPKGDAMRIAKAIQGSGRGSGLRLSTEDRRTILERYRESNEWAFDRADNADEHPNYFEPPVADPSEPDPGTMNETLTIDDVVAFSAALWSADDT